MLRKKILSTDLTLKFLDSSHVSFEFNSNFNQLNPFLKMSYILSIPLGNQTI